MVHELTSDRRRLATIAPALVALLAATAARLPLALAWPRVALLLHLWIVSDAMMLALLARTRRPPARLVIGTLALAALAVWIGAPAPMRHALSTMPALALVMTALLLLHVALAVRRAAAADGLSLEARVGIGLGDLLPPPLGRFAAAEWSILHMALFRWGGTGDVPAGCRGFAYHRHLAPISAALLILSGIEVGTYHLLVGHWSRTAAIVMFVLSDLGLVYLVGLIKSFRLRPVLLTPDGVRVRAGFLIDRLVPFDRIVSIEGGLIDGAAVRDPATLNAALLAWPNILLRLSGPVEHRAGPRRRRIDAIAFRLDDPEDFLRILRWRMGRAAG
ncbi:hypothetical protein GCM10011380_11830 [Sphingomonas metalli]|uniref:PH domain-containing protein n=2 Tax=Sphingomonas metalli TaxID=1779358 RepID=A0A916SZR0_9SPHN|nr:hypothetical protein GCM10011380_11830 [Sphingomonas metalli]